MKRAKVRFRAVIWQDDFGSWNGYVSKCTATRKLRYAAPFLHEASYSRNGTQHKGTFADVALELLAAIEKGGA